MRYILRGLIKCANPDCGCTITPEKAKGIIYYSCTNHKKIHKKRIYVPETELMKPIYELLKKISLPNDKIETITKELRKTHEVKNKFNNQVIANLRAQYDKFEKRINNLLDMRLDGSITTDLYDKKLKELKESQYEINDQINQHTKADENYYITANTVLNLCQRAHEIFKMATIEEKQKLLNFLLQNLTLDGKKLQYKLKAPFDSVLKATECSTGLGLWDDVGTEINNNF